MVRGAVVPLAVMTTEFPETAVAVGPAIVTVCVEGTVKAL